MKHFLMVLTIGFFITGTAVGADLNRYNGTWSNLSAYPKAVTKIEISVVDSKAHVHACGQLHPQKDYDWGWEPASSYSDGHLTTRYQTSSCLRALTITLTGSGRLVVKTHTNFTDNSGRPDRDETDTLKRLPTPTTQQTPQPMDPATPKPMDWTTPKPMDWTIPKPVTNEPTGKY